jgi:hypothetical protein
VSDPSVDAESRRLTAEASRLNGFPYSPAAAAGELIIRRRRCAMTARQFIPLLCASAALGCVPAHSDTTQPKEQTVHTERGAQSAEDLKTRFLRHHRDNDVESMLALFYLKGASQRMVDLYRGAIPKAEELTITSAEVTEITKERQTNITHTLTPEKLLLLKYSKTNQEGPAAVEQFFYIGRQDGRYYFTLPTGQ